MQPHFAAVIDVLSHHKISQISFLRSDAIFRSPSWQDPVKYNFAHGGKDGVPYPVARETYDKSISYLSSAIEGAEIEREQKIQALRKLAEYSARMFKQDKS